MKLHRRVLMEAPYEISGSMKREPFSSFTSDTSLGRLYTPLGSMKTGGQEITLSLRNTMQGAIGTVKGDKPTGEPSNRIIFILDFKKRHTLENVPDGIDEGKILQVKSVAVDPELEGVGIASFAYSSLAKRGHVVLSDTSQFADGKALWKRMAARAHLHEYRIFVLDDEYGFKERDGEPISYDGQNIDDAEIWTRGKDLAGSHVLLAMK
jgi:hypothetical protein